MSNPKLSDELALNAVEALREAGTNAAAARLLDIAPSTFDNRIRVAASRGLDGSIPDPAPAGFAVKSNGIRYNAAGMKAGQSVKFGPEVGEKFELPDGMTVKEMSVLTDGDDQTKLKWHRLKAGQRTPEQIAAEFEKAFENFKPVAPAIKSPTTTYSDQLVAYIMCDWHIGMMAQAALTDGENFDLKIAREMIVTKYKQLIDLAPPSTEALLLGLGDLMHVDNNKGLTPAHANMLDYDTRYPKILLTTNEILAEIVAYAAQKHQKVTVDLKEGNHDPDSTPAMRYFLYAWFRDEDRISVDLGESPFMYRQFGVNYLASVHGDKIKLDQLPLLMATMYPEMFAGTSTWHWHTGHLHHEVVKEYHGIIVHQHRAPIPPDFFHSARGYRAGRSIKAFLYHETEGSRGDLRLEIK